MSTVGKVCFTSIGWKRRERIICLLAEQNTNWPRQDITWKFFYRLLNVRQPLHGLQTLTYLSKPLRLRLQRPMKSELRSTLLVFVTLTLTHYQDRILKVLSLSFSVTKVQELSNLLVKVSPTSSQVTVLFYFTPQNAVNVSSASLVKPTYVVRLEPPKVKV